MLWFNRMYHAHKRYWVPGSMKTIMVVDDEKNVVESLKLVFEDKYRLCPAYTGKDALRKLRTNRPENKIF